MSVVDGGDGQMHETPRHLRGGRGYLDRRLRPGEVLHEEVTSAPAGQTGKGVQGAQHSLCKGRRPRGRCRSLQEHKVSWKVRLRSNKKVLR